MNVTFESIETTISLHEQHLANLYGDLTTKVIAAVIHTAIQVGGGFLWFGIAHFEKFGGDPCKRSISNQLISYIVLKDFYEKVSSKCFHGKSVLFGNLARPQVAMCLLLGVPEGQDRACSFK